MVVQSNSQFTNNIAVAVVKGCSPNGMVVYPNMLMLVTTHQQNLLSLPVFSTSAEIGEADPFITIARGMEAEFGTKTPYMKFLFRDQAIKNTKGTTVKTILNYYDVRINGHVRKKPRKYSNMLFRDIDYIRNKESHITIALNRYLIWSSKQNSTQDHIQKAMEAMNRTALAEKLNGAPDFGGLKIAINPVQTAQKEIMTVRGIKDMFGSHPRYRRQDL